MKLKNRTVLITGGTSGIGFEMARQLTARGNVVLVTGRNEENGDAARSRIPGLHFFASDVANPADVRRLSGLVLRQFPDLSVIINNAGIMRNIRFDKPHQLEDLTSEIDINLKGPIWVVEQFLPQLLSRSDALIVNVSSGLAFVPFPAAPIYSAAKAAVHAFTVSLRALLRQSSVRVVELAPPATETPLFRREFAKEMQREKGLDVRKLVTRAIASIEDGKDEVRPGLSNVLWLASRFAPGTIFKQMVRLSQIGAAPPEPELALKT